MALTNVIRRAVSGVIPSTTRVTGSQRHYHYHHKSLSTTFAPIPCTGSLSQNLFRSSFSTTTPQPYPCQSCLNTTRQQCYSTLRKEIDSEIEDKAADFPESFPFEIENETSLLYLTLTRHYHGEKITVDVYKPYSITKEELSMTVSVSKKDGPCLDFRIYVRPDGIEIRTLTINDPYESRDFKLLDENVQKAFHKYLDIRGINPRSTMFLHKYMINRDSKACVQWLKKVQTFVEV